MTRWFMSFMLLIILLTSCSQPMEATDMDTEETAIYSVLLDGAEAAWVVQQEVQATGYGVPDSGWLGYITKEMPGVDKTTIASFQDRNASEYVLDGRIDPRLNVVLLSRQDYDAVFQAGGWDEFYRRYPSARGFTTLSRVGFNKDLTQAFVYMGTMSGPLAGAGYYYLLEKVDGTWQVTQQVMAWIS